jgi:hypothetical protein
VIRYGGHVTDDYAMVLKQGQLRLPMSSTFFFFDEWACSVYARV